MSASDGSAPESTRLPAVGPGDTKAGPPPALVAVAGSGAIALWFLLMGRFGAGIYALMGPFALGVASLVGVLFRARLGDWLQPTRRGVLVGVAVGVTMTLATYPLYALACAIYPGLRVEVAVLYAAARETPLSESLPWVLAIIVAEELLWRGALLEAFAGRVSPLATMAISVATYCVAQAGTGSWIVTLLALVCGALWTLQRHVTRSVLSPLIAHLIWTPTVILLLPVNATVMPP